MNLRPWPQKEITLPEYAEHEVGMIPQLAARFETAAQLPGAEYLAKLRYLILPIREADAVPQPLRCKTLLELPRAAFGTVEPDTMRRLAALEGSGFAGVVANNLAQFGYASPLPVFGGLGLNVTNPMSAAEYVCLGARGLLVQPETALTAMRAVAPRQKDGTPVPTAALCYGHLPLMLTRACPLRNVRTSCAGCTHKGKLRDRKGRDFPGAVLRPRQRRNAHRVQPCTTLYGGPPDRNAGGPCRGRVHPGTCRPRGRGSDPPFPSAAL